jgi:hypothetical protein
MFTYPEELLVDHNASASMALHQNLLRNKMIKVSQQLSVKFWDHLRGVNPSPNMELFSIKGCEK